MSCFALGSSSLKQEAKDDLMLAILLLLATLLNLHRYWKAILRTAVLPAMLISHLFSSISQSNSLPHKHHSICGLLKRLLLATSWFSSISQMVLYAVHLIANLYFPEDLMGCRTVDASFNRYTMICNGYSVINGSLDLL